MDSLNEAGAAIAREIQAYETIENELASLETFLRSQQPQGVIETADAVGSALERVKKAETKIFHAANKYQKAVDAAMPENQVLNIKDGVLDHEETNRDLDRAIFWHLIRKGSPDFAKAVKYPAFQRVNNEDEDLANQALPVFRTLQSMRSDPIFGAHEALAWLKQCVSTHEEVAKDERVSELFILLLKNASLSFQDLQVSEQVIKLRQLAQPIRGYVPEKAVSELATKVLLRSKNTEEDTQREVDRAADLLSEIASKILGLSNQSSLSTASRAAQHSLPQLWRAQKVTTSNGPAHWLSDGEQPLIEVDLPNDLRFHTIFACPIMKDDNPDNGPPVLLPCKHIISTNAMRNLSEQSNGTRRCPYCPSTFLAAQATNVVFA